MKVKIVSTKHFDRQLKKLLKKKPQIKSLLQNVMILLSEFPIAESLRIHKLKGDLKNKWACSLTHDLRMIFKQKDHTITLLDIGSHDEVY